MKTTHWPETVLLDIRFAVRTARQSPGVPLAAVGTLALAIGANTAIFSIVSGVLLRPLPFADPGRLMLLNETNSRFGAWLGPQPARRFHFGAPGFAGAPELRQVQPASATAPPIWPRTLAKQEASLSSLVLRSRAMRRLAIMVLAGGGLPLLGWGPEGHNLVARMADAYLTAAARARVAEILGPGVTLASISSWPDQIRRSRPETAPWHYIDIPISLPHLDLKRDCPKGDCVIVKIEDFEKVLGDPAAKPEQRREALMFLVHFVGDMHQPLHCSDNKDRGGNEMRTDFFGKPMNLHSVWDGGLLARMGEEEKLFVAFSKDLTPGRQKKWARGTVEDWAEQAHKASQKIVYGKLPKVAAGTPVPIGEAYERAADPLIRQQIEKAGARLAGVLNATLR